MKNTKLVIDIQELLPEQWIVEDAGFDKIKVYYLTKGRGNSPHPVILPRKISITDNLIEGVAMYIGDGKLSADLQHLEFTSKDKDMISFMESFFKNNFNYPISKIRIRDSCYSFQISSKIMRQLFEEIVKIISSLDYSSYQNLRRAFLRGLFASEGGIAIQTRENYLAYLAFHLSYEKEEWLADFVQKLLMMEGINSNHLTRKTKGERFVQITGWKNYAKCFNMRLFDLNERKRNKALRFLSNRKFYCQISPELKDRIVENSNPRKLSLTINESYGKISKNLRKKSMRLEELVKICEFKHIPLMILKENISAIGMKTQPGIIEDKEFINFIINLKYQKTWLP